MRTIGWCERCRKIKPVRVLHQYLRTSVGICAACEQKEEEARRGPRS